ncbi:MAG: tRNA (adenosine(37)-N6)-threonylcarbamoyltransferase complex ATPase subunit type 1 TsaE [Hyphomicrobiaceae bacterium]|nr:tRNA (adenosine(37)-N6)-threonylcarbamoyltransferase complex ATPase subunit type 1 TsaE [Hyphomicrobiaceae bacterium]MCC0023977.1 tRNA (adenosine(37)-N6)-threonylcarbamoyltransferase complex ATPase subunit type 1 TsaE [Hyphomicrobiaceae bacterium]
MGLILANEAETIAFSETLAAQLRAGDLILLSGPLGAGKSTVARAIVRSLVGQPDLDVPSPTFLLVLPYEGKGHLVLHADLYRIEDVREVDELGLDEDPQAIVLVEWPDRDPALATRADLFLDLRIAPEEKGRECELRVADPDRRRALSVLLEDFGNLPV